MALSTEDKLDLLMDLKHDLGKYLVMPLAMLKDGATGPEVFGALEKALFETRVTPRGTRSARMIWETFEHEAAGCFSEHDGYRSLEDSVSKALDWENRLQEQKADLPLQDILGDMRKVGQSVSALIEEVKSDS